MHPYLLLVFKGLASNLDVQPFDVFYSVDSPITCVELINLNSSKYQHKCVIILQILFAQNGYAKVLSQLTSKGYASSVC